MVFSRTLTILVQLASIVVLTRVLSKEAFGLLSFLLLAYSTVVTLAQLGLPDSIFYFFERVPAAARRRLALVTGRTLFLFGATGSVVFVALTFLAPKWGFHVGWLFLPFMLLALLELPTLPVPNVLIAVDRARAAAWLNILASLFQFCALVAPALLGKPVAVLVWSLAGYGVVRFALSAWLFFRSLPQTGGELPPGIVRQQLRYSVPVALAQILWGLNKQIDKYIVAAFLPVAVYAEYVVGSWEIPLIPAIAYTAASVMMPHFVAFHAKGEQGALLALWRQSIQKVTLVVVPLTILFLLIAEEFIVVVFSPDYARAAIPFRIYTLILLHRVAAYSSLLKALGETRTITASALYLVGVNVMLSIPLVIWLGMAGPPLATLLANLVTWLYVLLKIRAVLGVRLRELFPFGPYTRTLLVAVLCGLPVYLGVEFLDMKPVAALSAKTAAYLLLFAGVATWTRVFLKEDWRYVFGWLPRRKVSAAR